MNNIVNTLKFYRNPLILITVLNLFFFIALGVYFESYEGFFSAFLQGIYSKPFQDWWDVSTHILLYFIYEKGVSLWPDYNIYGIVLFIYNWVGLTMLGLVLYRILSIHIKKESLFLFILLYSLISLDTFVNLSTTRIAFVFIATVLCYIESRKFEGRAISGREWLVIAIFIFFASLIRMASTVLFVIIYIVILFIHKRLTKDILIPVLMSGVVFLFYYTVVINVTSEPKQVLITKEKEIFDRDNIDYSKLSERQLLDITALNKYGITDKDHFKLSFYNSISKYKNKKGIFSLSDGFAMRSFINTFKNSLQEFYTAKYYVLYYLFTSLLLMSGVFINRRAFFLQLLFLTCIPAFLCFITIVPLRFLVPFLSISGTINIIVYLNYNRYKKGMLAMLTILIILIFSDELKSKKEYVETDIKFEKVQKKIELLSSKNTSSEPIVINNSLNINYYPIKPLKKISRQHVLFLNLFYFNALGFQTQSWNELCHCDALSLKEKIDYIVLHQNLFIIDEETFAFMRKYLLSKYNVVLAKKDITYFDGQLNVCRLIYN